MKSRLEIILEKLPNQEVELSAHKIELATQKIELAMDFSAILKELQADVSKSNKQQAQLEKIAKQFIDAKSPDRSGVPANRQKKVNAFYKDFEKKAKDLGIDVRTTQFYKEYQTALDLIDQVKDTVMEVNSIIKSVK